MKYIKQSVLLIAAVGLTACFHIEEETNVTPGQAFSNAFVQIEKVGTKANGLVTEQTDNSTAYNTLTGNSFLSNAGSGGNTTFFKASSNATPPNELPASLSSARDRLLDMLQHYTSLANNSSAKQKITNRASHLEQDNQAMLTEAEVNEFLSGLFNPPTQVGNTVTYTLKRELCGADASCLKLADNFTMQLIIKNNESGSISFNVNNNPITIFRYAPDFLSLEIFLGGLKEVALLTEDPTITDAIPQTFSGSFKSSIELISDTRVEIIASIPQAIDIDGVIEGEEIKTSIASTNKLFAVIADSSEESVSVELGLGLLYAKFMDSEISPNEFEVKLEALTGLFTLDVASESLTATNIGIGNQPFIINIDATNAVTVDMATFGFTTDGATEEITLTSDIDLNIYALNVNGALGVEVFDLADDGTYTSLTGELSIAAPAGTVFSDIPSGNYYTDIMEIVSGGPLSINGTGYFSTDITVNSGECLESTVDTDAFGDGMSVTSCSPF